SRSRTFAPKRRVGQPVAHSRRRLRASAPVTGAAPSIHHPPWRPGKGRQGAKVSPETGTMWRTTAQTTAAFLDLPSAPHAHGRNFIGQSTKEDGTAVRRSSIRRVLWLC